MRACLFVVYLKPCVVSIGQDSEKYVDQLLALFNRFSLLVKEAFVDDPRFLTARDKVCHSFPLSHRSLILTCFVVPE